MADKPHTYGWCTRLDGSRVPVYFLYEIEDGKAQINVAGTDEFLDLNESYESLGGRKANRPGRPVFHCTEKR